MTINTNTELFTSFVIGMSTVTNPLTRNNWRASLVPAAAVIPAPKAYISFAAVKKLVVELWIGLGGAPLCWGVTADSSILPFGG